MGSSPEDSWPSTHPTPGPAHRCSAHHPHPFILEHIRERRAEDCLHPHSAQNKATMPLWRCENEYLCRGHPAAMNSCPPLSPVPKPIPSSREEDQEGCQKSQRVTFTILCLPCERRQEWHAPRAMSVRWGGGGPNLIAGFASYLRARGCTYWFPVCTSPNTVGWVLLCR